jgi:hypothetical protein
MSVRVLIRAVSSSSFPGGHADLNGGHPDLVEDSFERVLVVEVPLAPLGPKIVKEETKEDIKGLFRIRKYTYVISVEIGGIVLMFDYHLSKKDERPGECRDLERVPIFPDLLESLPSTLGKRAIQQVVLGGFRHSYVAYFARGGDPHELQLGAYWEALVEGQPDERAHLLREGAMPDSCDDLRVRGVS